MTEPSMGRKRPRSRAKQSNIASKDAADVVIEERGQGGTDEDLDSCKTPAAKRRATSQTSGRDLDDSESAREGDMETVNIASASSDLLESICSSLIGRKKQVETLIQLFEEVGFYCSPHILISFDHVNVNCFI